MENSIPTPPEISVSVVIPMYNTEKYIGACLESIFGQTFQNFEVIVVDDCSTDRSPEIVKSYIPKFGGRLKLYRMKKNSGPGGASNKGVALSTGKYVYIPDSDDLITRNALGELYNFAENSKADAIFMDTGFRFINGADKIFPTSNEDIQGRGWHAPPFVDKPTFESDDIGERVKKFCSNGMGWTAISKFVRRDLLIENEITFPVLRTSQDIVWVMELIVCAKKILTIPNPYYIHRPNPTSLTAQKRSAENAIHFFMDANAEGLKILDDFLSDKKFFKDNPEYRWMLLEFFEQINVQAAMNAVENIPRHEVYEILRPKFEEMFGSCGNLISYLSASSMISKIGWLNASQKILELENKK